MIRRSTLSTFIGEKLGRRTPAPSGPPAIPRRATSGYYVGLSGRPSSSSAGAVRVVLLGADLFGLDRGSLLAAAGLNDASLEGADDRVPRVAVGRLWKAAVKASGDPGFGLRVALQTPPGILGVVDHAVRNCATLGDSLGLLVRYAALLQEGSEYRVRTTDTEVRVDLHYLRGQPRSQDAHMEWILANWVLGARRMTASDAALVEVRFAHPAPAHLDLHREVFGCTPRFDCEGDGVTVGFDAMQLPVLGADELLGTVVRDYADRQLVKLGPLDDLQARVRRLLLEQPELANDMKGAAKALGFSPRTLQRRLGEIDTNYRELVDTLRGELARHHLADPSLSVSEVAFLLGYAEPSAFHRAFKRWFGMTPQAWRDR